MKYRDPPGLWQFTAFTSYTVKVYKPEFEALRKLNVSGGVYLYSLDYSFPCITPSGEAYAYKNRNAVGARSVFHRFIHQVKGPGINKREKDETPGGSMLLAPSGYTASIPSNFSISLNGGLPEKEYNSQVYMRLQMTGQAENRRVRTVDWFAGADEWFMFPPDE